MIFFNPIILASEFITHVVLVVLIGIEIVVYVNNRGFKNTSNSTRLDDFYWIATITAFGVLWVFAEFFGVFSIPYFIFVRFGIIALIIAIVVYHNFLSSRRHSVVSNLFAVWFSVFIGAFILSNILYIYLPTALTGVLYAVSRIVAILAYYFFIMYYLIKINYEQ